MKNAILLHGLPSKQEYYSPDYPSSSNSHWFPWLQKELLVRDIKADTPEIFKVFEMRWQSWVEEVERFMIGPNTTLVGHSAGGGFWIRYLSEHPEIIVDKIILVAPWMDVKHEETGDFFNFIIDPRILGRTNELVIFFSDDDDQEVKDTVNILTAQLPGISVREFHRYGHFTQQALCNNFPELLEAILSKPF